MSSDGDATGSLDREVLARLLRTLGTPEEFHAMLRDFLAGSGVVLADLQLALQAGRLPELERSAHTLKSMAHLVGAHALEATCRHVETAARGGALDPAGTAALPHEVQGAQEAVARFLP